MRVKVKSKSAFNTNCLFRQKTLIAVSLLFMLTIAFSPRVNGWLGVTENVMVETEVELVNAVNSAPIGERYVIGISKDIVLEKPLEILNGKDIYLLWIGQDVHLIGANGMDTIIVRSGGLLTMYGYIIITHAEGNVGRGLFIERGGTVFMAGIRVSGNTADKGGGIYNGGTLYIGGFEDRDSIIINNTATLGSGLYNKGVFEVKSLHGQIHGNTNLSGDDDNVFNEEPADNKTLYLLSIVLVIVVVAVSVACLLFYRSKKKNNRYMQNLKERKTLLLLR